MAHHVDRIARLGTSVLITGIWYKKAFGADYVASVFRSMMEGSSLTVPERFQLNNPANLFGWFEAVRAARDGPVPAGLTAHIAFRGDVIDDRGMVAGSFGSGFAIQGLMFSVDLPRGEFEYRVLDRDGQWSAWAPCGTYLGTRGRSLSLHGYAVRLRGMAAERYECLCAATFVGEQTPVVSTDQCRSSGALEAVVVRLRARR